MGASIQVSSDGLHDAATQCDEAAAALSQTGARSAAGPSFQPTTTAVKYGYSVVVAAAGMLATRAIDTGATLRAAAGSYTSTDGNSAEQIGAVGKAIEV